MYLYKCKILDKFYTVREQFLLATSEEEAKKIIEKQKLTLITIKSKRIVIQNFTLPFFKILQQLITNNFNILNSLDIIVNFFPDQRKVIINNLIDKIKSGYTFSQSLSQFDQFFNPMVIQIIKVSEQTANLTQSIKNIVEYLENQEKIKQKIKKTSRYPIIVLLMTISIIIVWIFYLIPQFSAIFKDLEIETPLITKHLLQFSNFVLNNKFFVLSIFLLIIIYIKYNFSNILSKLTKDIKGQVIKLNFCESLALMLKEKINLIVALKHLSDMPEFKKYQDIVQFIRQGYTLSESFKLNKNFSLNELVIISSGDESGQPWVAFQTLANIIKFKLNEKFAKLAVILPICLIAITGILLLLLLYSTILPLYSSLDLQTDF